MKSLSPPLNTVKTVGKNEMNENGELKKKNDQLKVLSRQIEGAVSGREFASCHADYAIVLRRRNEKMAALGLSEAPNSGNRVLNLLKDLWGKRFVTNKR